MSALSWKNVIPAAAAVIALGISVTYISKKDNKTKQVEENDRKNEQKEKAINTLDWMDQLDDLKEKLQTVNIPFSIEIKEKTKHQISAKDIIEMHHKGKWRKAVVNEILEALQVSVYDMNDSDKIQRIIIDSKQKIFCDCYDVCQENHLLKHRIRLDNKQSIWANSIRKFLNSKQNYNTILKEELNFYGICTAYWNEIKETNDDININNIILCYARKYNQFMINIASFIKQEGIKKNTKASNYIFDHFFADKQIDLSIIFMWRIHMLHPFLYRKDCMNHFGFILSPTFHKYITNIKLDEKDDYAQYELDIAVYQSLVYGNNQPLLKHQLHNTPLFTRFNFEKSLKKNLIFMENILQKTKKMRNLNFTNEVSDYKIFLYFGSYFINANKENNIDLHLCPLLMRDFVWHTHLLFPDQYFEECPLYTDGKIIMDHRDIIPEQQIKIYLEFSLNFWQFVECYEEKLRSLQDRLGVKKQIAQMIVETERANNQNALLVFGFLAEIHKRRQYPSEIDSLCFQFYADKIIWNNHKIEKKFVDNNARVQNCSGCCM